ncbi:ComF family protein [Paenibacillus sp. FA6]|uniref:ComF family protein n=1 Tax=Paenibacillus sp. FA6 TaxID=3413029 RepID=UPI003F658E7E
MTWKSILDSIHRLLAPAVVACLTCGRMGNRSTQVHGICPDCYKGIPWIRQPRCCICGRHIGCPDCTRINGYERFFECNRSAVAYKPMMREWLGQYKYRGNERYSELLVMMLGKAYVSMRNEHRQTKVAPPWTIDVITCVPVSTIRLEERGFNQAEVLAIELAELMRLPFARMLLRERHTDKQSFKSRSERIRDMQNVFSGDQNIINIAHNILQTRQRSLGNAPLRILVIDDIYTTGSTINACACVLKEIGKVIGYPVEVFSLTWARS